MLPFVLLRGLLKNTQQQFRVILFIKAIFYHDIRLFLFNGNFFFKRPLEETFFY